MAQLARATGIVLRTQNHAETDRIAVLLTPGEGRLDVLAKGARRLERVSGAALDVSNLVEAIFYRRRGLALLKDVDLKRTFPGIRGEVPRLTAALEGLAWALRLVPKGQPDPSPFQLTLSFLSALDRGASPGPLKLGYQLRLLSAVGHAPHLRGCLRCGREEELTWSPEEGGLLCRVCGGEGKALEPRLIRTMQGLARLPLPALGRLRVDEGLLREIGALLLEFREGQLSR